MVECMVRREGGCVAAAQEGQGRGRPGRSIPLPLGLSPGLSHAHASPLMPAVAVSALSVVEQALLPFPPRPPGST